MEEKTEGQDKTSVSEKSSEPKEVGKMRFDYIKSNQFRVIHADGVHGGIVPNCRFIQMAFFSERAPIPKWEEFKLDAGRLDAKIGAKKRNAVVREVEVELLMTVEAAKAVHTWIGEKIKDFEHIESELPKK